MIWNRSCRYMVFISTNTVTFETVIMCHHQSSNTNQNKSDPNLVSTKVHKCLWNIIWGISVSISELENCFEWRTIISIIILILQHSKCPLSPSSHKVFTKPHLHQSSDKLIVFRDSTLDSWKFRESRIETQVTVNLLLSSTVLKWYLFHLIISGANRFRGTWSN